MNEDFLTLWKTLDHNKIADAIQAEPIPDYDFKDAKLCVYTAAERWLLRDLSDFVVDGIEKRHTILEPAIVALGGVKSYFDLEGGLTGKTKEFTNYAGKRFILDWKSASVALDRKWADRQLLSFQWKGYGLVEPRPSLFFYRGIRRPNSVGAGVDLRELIIEIPGYNEEDSMSQLIGQLTMRNSLIQIGAEVWPRSMPEACFTYGRVCPYFEDCDTFSMPRKALDNSREMSYTRLKTFASCPERHRRDLIHDEEGKGDDENTYTLFGSAVHRGLAELYSQTFKVEYEDRNEKIDIPEHPVDRL